MAKKISQLTQATQVKSDDVTVIVQDGETKKLPLNLMVTKQDIENKKVAGLAKLDEIEATYENDTYTPTITVKNKSSVKTGEGDEVDYSANVMDGHAKSAILTGQTLVNISMINKFSLTDGNKNVRTYGKMIYGKKYLQIIAITKNTMINSDNNNDIAQINAYEYNSNHNFDVEDTIASGFIGVKKLIGMASRNDKRHDTSVRSYSNSVGVLEGYEILIEYQEGMENWDIPYFEGMQSVKMPVLKTTGGKNLMISSLRYDVFLDADGTESTHFQDIVSKEFIQVESSTSYGIATFYQGEILSPQNIFICEYDNGKNFIRRYNATNTDGVFTTNIKTKYIKFSIGGTGIPSDIKERKNILIELEKTNIKPTSYEPFKSNILTVNEPIELRGVGDVQDELDCLTGELTQRIGEVVLNGSETWYLSSDTTTNTIRFHTYLTDKKIGVLNMISDKLPTKDVFSSDEVGILGNYSNTLIYVRVLKSNVASLDEFTTYLSTNPITVQYCLATESVKTVDLMPSGTHPSTTPYCWKNGHIQLSSSGLLPNLEYSVVTSRAGQINQNATMVVKNDKRIFDLEILLAGGLVNTTYQALTLQNQVETGLSKVSLNSETEPDYLLYHMIMKLIEEKAYKLDDLTEKVSVFYLYEKLSDEQFETIYSALYPFVEDEIVEEPVVEELPEVVEDEVIM